MVRRGWVLYNKTAVFAINAKDRLMAVRVKGGLDGHAEESSLGRKRDAVCFEL
jgi:hypothetical protein